LFSSSCRSFSSFLSLSLFFFFTDTATPEIYTLSYTTLFRSRRLGFKLAALLVQVDLLGAKLERLAALAKGHHFHAQHPAVKPAGDRKSTRLNSSHVKISYAVFCLKKKKKNNYSQQTTTKR